MSEIINFREWLQEECPKEDIRFLDEAKTIEYIPVGITEAKLDNFHSWSTGHFRFEIIRAGNFWFATGSIKLKVTFPENDKMITLKRNGGATFKISSDSTNLDFEGTILSLALSNAAKKLGNKFGRSLNGRMERGENAVLINDGAHIEDEKIDPETDRWMKLIAGSKTLEQLANHKKGLPKKLTPFYTNRLKILSNGSELVEHKNKSK